MKIDEWVVAHLYFVYAWSEMTLKSWQGGACRWVTV